MPRHASPHCFNATRHQSRSPSVRRDRWSCGNGGTSCRCAGSASLEQPRDEQKVGQDEPGRDDEPRHHPERRLQPSATTTAIAVLALALTAADDATTDAPCSPLTPSAPSRRSPQSSRPLSANPHRHRTPPPLRPAPPHGSSSFSDSRTPESPNPPSKSTSCSPPTFLPVWAATPLKNPHGEGAGSRPKQATKPRIHRTTAAADPGTAIRGPVRGEIHSRIPGLCASRTRPRRT
jgi:hypothetical protein